MYKQQNLYETILPQPNILHHLEPTSEDFRMLLLSRRVSNMLRMQVDCRLIIQWVAINSNLYTMAENVCLGITLIWPGKPSQSIANLSLLPSDRLVADSGSSWPGPQPLLSLFSSSHTLCVVSDDPDVQVSAVEVVNGISFQVSWWSDINKWNVGAWA